MASNTPNTNTNTNQPNTPATTTTTTTTTPESQDLTDLKTKQAELDALLTDYNTRLHTYLRDVSGNISQQWNIRYPVRIRGQASTDLITHPNPFTYPNNTKEKCFTRCKLNPECGFALYSNNTNPYECKLYKSNPNTRLEDGSDAPESNDKPTDWQCIAGLTSPMRVNKNNDAECMLHEDGRNCRWRSNMSQCNAEIANAPANVGALTAGEMHRRIWGSTGYEWYWGWPNIVRRNISRPPNEPTREYHGYEKPMWENKRNTNAISTTTPPIGTPGTNIGTDWIFLGKHNNLSDCQKAAIDNSGIFTKIVYINDNTPGRDGWHKSCYGNTVGGTSYNTSTGNLDYTTSIPPYGYTKLGVHDPSGNSTKTAAQIEKIRKLNELKAKIDAKNLEVSNLMKRIFGNTSLYLSSMSDPSSNVNPVFAMNHQTKFLSDKLFGPGKGGYTELKNVRDENQSQTDNINVYDETNTQVGLNSRKFVYVLYAVIAIFFIFGLMFYTSDLTWDEMKEKFGGFLKGQWWSAWWVIVITIAAVLIGTVGWDAREAIKNVIRVITNPTYWLGDKWWIGVSGLVVLYMIYLFYTQYGGKVGSIISPPTEQPASN
jgi:hypothetical protein